MNQYVQEFMDKISIEAPAHFDMKMGNSKISIAEDQNYDGLRYNVRIKSSLIQLIVKYRYPLDLTGDNYRYEINLQGRSRQLTCFHFGEIGLTSGKSVVELSQKIMFVNRDSHNNDRKDQACK